MADFSKVKTALEKKLRELTARATEIDDDLSQPPDDDWDDNAIESEDDDVLEAVGNITVNEIQQIRLALSQIDAGKYGDCISCGEAIAKERLKALPFATKCVRCSQH